ncbi:SlyX family protein [Saccharospirillum mangrovi]|uniref:SlyX family protein n=1 Tax=Saccharospirillum mangrovi TaxID=2161747 RepID=UPI000D3D64EF|nr:SlyX family protein [Saccharospirillum mangrovi]
MSQTERLIDLETRLTHLDDTIEALDQVVIAQQDRIERLERALQRLLADQQSLREALPAEIDNKPPPHY